MYGHIDTRRCYAVQHLEKCSWPSARWKMSTISIEYRIECSSSLSLYLSSFVLSLFPHFSLFHRYPFASSFVLTSLMWKTNSLIRTPFGKKEYPSCNCAAAVVLVAYTPGRSRVRIEYRAFRNISKMISIWDTRKKIVENWRGPFRFTI